VNGKDSSKQVGFWIQFGLVQVKENFKGVDGFVFLVGGDASLNKGDRKKSITGRCVKNHSKRVTVDSVRFCKRKKTEKQLACFLSRCCELLFRSQNGGDFGRGRGEVVGPEKVKKMVEGSSSEEEGVSSLC